MIRITPDISVRGLFFRRWLDHFRKQLNLLRSTFDGIVLLYIGIPALLLLGRVYFGLWREELPEWLLQLPLTAVPVLLLLLIYVLGGVILYIEAADVLFLKQRSSWKKGLLIRGALAGMVSSLLIIGVCFVLIAPLLNRVYSMGLTDILLLFAITCGFKSVHLFGANLIAILWSGWKSAVLQSAAFSILGSGFTLWVLLGNGRPASAILPVAICLGLTWLMAWIRLRLNGRFHAEVREDERQKTLLTGLLLAGSVDRPPAVRTRPWLFRRGGRLFRSSRPEVRIAEATFKSFFRGREFKLYSQFVFFGCLAVYFPPYPVNFIVYASVLALLIYWLNGHRRAFFTRDLLSILPLEEFTEYRAASRTMRLLLYPGVLFMTAVIGATVFHTWWGTVLAALVSLLVTIVLAPMWKLFAGGYRRS
ncbi:ABC-2 type transport system permease protein [Fontibacillus phaseoli]|uniref:ABC-2 type transport system permease protein n=1 Tax=Fontibacillus phaseoli TaxID=1416533 RepID=A0A369B3V6_9BACL|nr:ABC transporter permease [Fontibacillus phaseoli]RCX16193.1 ABC-2 type transport system permease protein [Fontibacillus phaseoli]